MITSMIKKLLGFFAAEKTVHPPLTTDLHSHLIPGIDDGAKTMEASLQLIRELKRLGYTRLITTPHIMSHRYKNSADTILRGLDNLRENMRQADLNLSIDAAAEYYLDEHFYALIQRKELLTFGRNEVLFEMSYVFAPPDLESVIFEMQSSGYVPVLAHPERYMFMHSDFEQYARLKSLGVKFQVNCNSLGGYYSKPVQKAAKKIMGEGWIDYLGSDTHHRRHLEALEKTINSGILAKAMAQNPISNQTL